MREEVGHEELKNQLRSPDVLPVLGPGVASKSGLRALSDFVLG
jgi:hypothetical protein